MGLQMEFLQRCLFIDKKAIFFFQAVVAQSFIFFQTILAVQENWKLLRASLGINFCHAISESCFRSNQRKYLVEEENFLTAIKRNNYKMVCSPPTPKNKNLQIYLSTSSQKFYLFFLRLGWYAFFQHKNGVLKIIHYSGIIKYYILVVGLIGNHYIIKYITFIHIRNVNNVNFILLLKI